MVSALWGASKSSLSAKKVYFECADRLGFFKWLPRSATLNLAFVPRFVCQVSPFKFMKLDMRHILGAKALVSADWVPL